MFSIHRMLFLPLKKVQIIKITSPFSPPSKKNLRQQNFQFPVPPLGGRDLPTLLSPYCYLENPAYCLF